MRNAKINDVVTCERAGRGQFKVIQTRDGVTTELRLQSLDRPTDVIWMDEYFCTKDIGASERARQLLATQIGRRSRYA